MSARKLLGAGNVIDAAGAFGRRPEKSCPSCGSAMDLVKASEGGMIEYAYFPTHPLRNAELPRRSRPANFWACSGCEHCEEVEP